MNNKKYMRILILFFVLLSGMNAHAQQPPAKIEYIRFDPSFWKEELRLNNDQYKQMQDINKEFYDRLVSAFIEMKDDRTAFGSAFAQCCINRNEQLWQTMNAR